MVASEDAYHNTYFYPHSLWCSKLRGGVIKSYTKGLNKAGCSRTLPFHNLLVNPKKSYQLCVISSSEVIIPHWSKYHKIKITYFFTFIKVYCYFGQIDSVLFFINQEKSLLQKLFWHFVWICCRKYIYLQCLIKLNAY